jgi:hypothetical protein
MILFVIQFYSKSHARTVEDLVKCKVLARNVASATEVHLPIFKGCAYSNKKRKRCCLNAIWVNKFTVYMLNMKSKQNNQNMNMNMQS